jgi:shikimate kinase
MGFIWLSHTSGSFAEFPDASEVLVIYLIGPAGAGKSTVAPHVATLVGVPVFDLDRAFETVHGDIDLFIQSRGYAAYAAANVETYVGHRPRGVAVLVLSSGFMVYPADVYPGIGRLQRDIAAAPTTVLLLPSVDLETCVAETVRRQATRALPIRRSAAREEAVIRERFARYRQLTSRVVTTMQPVEAVAREIIASLAEVTSGLISAAVFSNQG